MEQIYREEIINQFRLMDSKEDLLNLLNTILKYSSNQTSAFTLQQLSFQLINSKSVKRYKSFHIMKKSGGVRVINSPNVQLKKILGCLNQLFKIVANVHHCAMGFVANKSVVDNAKKHVGKNYVYNIDLKDFFHSFDRNRVKMGLWKSFYDLHPEKENISFLLACLVTHAIEIDGEEKYVLPQGSPSSPIITNILCYKLDVRLNGLAKRFRVSYSRYADDITFSSDVNVFNKSSFLNELHRIIIHDQKLFINEAKTRLQKNGYKKEVTGLIVNEKVNVTRHYIKQLRMWIYYIEKYGFKKADSIFRKDYVEEKSHVKYRFNSMNHVIQGKLDYLKMVKGEDDPTYLKLSNRFILLQRKNNSKKDTITIADKLNDFVNSDFNFDLL